jgi:sulfur carrier protein
VARGVPAVPRSSAHRVGLDRAVRPAYHRRMRATVNGDPMELPDGLTISALLEHLRIRAERVAVERNGAVIRKARHAEEKLSSGDVVEIVTFVGGG